jgi:hypothetical protein
MNKSTLCSFPFDKSDNGYRTIAQLMLNKFGARVPEKYLINALKARDNGFAVDIDIIDPLRDLVENHYRGKKCKMSKISMDYESLRRM